MPHVPKLLVINPNTSLEVGASIDAFARRIVDGSAEIATVSAGFGFPYLLSRVSTAIAAHAALDVAATTISAHGPPDAVVLACFGDPGLEALQELVGLPVAGFAESGLLAAAALPGRFVIAVNGTVWCDMLRELVEKLRIADKVSVILSIEDCDPSPAALADFISQQTKRHGAARAVLGGAGLIGVLPEVASAASVPILDPHREAMLKALRLAQTAQPARGTRTILPMQTSGLSSALDQLLGGSPDRRESEGV